MIIIKNQTTINGTKIDYLLYLHYSPMTFDIYELINRIRLKPAMYIGKNSVTALNSYLYGYIHALYDFKIEMIETPPFHGFHDWVAMKLGYFESTSGWSNMLLEAENGDEEEALVRFFVYLDEFKQRQSRVILWAVPDNNKYWRYQLIDGEKVDLPFPALVQIIKYTNDKGVFVRYLDENGELVDREEYYQDLEVAFSCTKWFIKSDAWKPRET